MLRKVIMGVLIVCGLVCADHLLSYASDPVSGVMVTVVKGEKVWDTTTGEDGRFAINKLPSGKYTVYFAIIPVVGVELSGNGKDHVQILSPVPEAGGVNTHIEITRNGKKLSGWLMTKKMRVRIPQYPCQCRKEVSLETKFENAEIDDRVYCAMFGGICETNLTITDITQDTVRVKSDIGNRVFDFYKDGSYLKQGNQILFWSKPKFEIPKRPKRMVKRTVYMGYNPQVNIDMDKTHWYSTTVLYPEESYVVAVGSKLKVIPIEIEVEEECS